MCVRTCLYVCVSDCGCTRHCIHECFHFSEVDRDPVLPNGVIPWVLAAPHEWPQETVAVFADPHSGQALVIASQIGHRKRPRTTRFKPLRGGHDRRMSATSNLWPVPTIRSTFYQSDSEEDLPDWPALRRSSCDE